MRAPVSWIREFVPDLPADVTGRQVAERIIAAGLEVETVESVGGEVTGPLVVGRVLSIEELREKEKLKKDIRYCRVDVGPEHNDTAGAGAGSRGIVCGARNFVEGDVVVVALPGAVLPGGFSIAARKTYGHVSDGMICSERELGVPEGDHDGIIVLPPDAAIGADATALLGLGEEVLDIAVTPDRGYALSIRGLVREVAIAYGIPFNDPGVNDWGQETGGYDVRIEAAGGCDRFVARTVLEVDPGAPTPDWMRRRLIACGMRPISLAVDITNYVMLELGQPLHAYDLSKLRGPIVVRQAVAGEKLETLDGAVRDLAAEDVLITDESGPIGLAGVMGGATTEISGTTTDVLIEAAHFDPVTIARAARRHRLPSEASRRFERGVDFELPPVAARRAANLLAELAGGSVPSAGTDEDRVADRDPISLRSDHPGAVAGRPIPADVVRDRLEQLGCLVSGDGAEDSCWFVTPPSWRPDLTDPVDLVEEVIRLEGYDSIPAVLPAAPAGRGLTVHQKRRRSVGRALAGAGFVEVLNYPFLTVREFDALGLPADDVRRVALRLANPISEAEPLLRTTLLPGLFAAARRNLGRGNTDLALFETGRVFRPSISGGAAPRLPVDRRATVEELAATEAALPHQPRHVAVVLCGSRLPSGWWGPGRAVDWADAVEAARTVAVAAGVALEVVADNFAPWHPGRCAALTVATADGALVLGHAGELHPRAIGELSLPPRTVAMELNLDLLLEHTDPVTPAPPISGFPPATQDVALVVAADVAAAEVAAALREGAGELLESIRLFDVWTGEQLGADRKSLAFALRFRAPDRTLTAEETGTARDAAVARATESTGAVLRGA